jgi:cation transport regulator ChaB
MAHRIAWAAVKRLYEKADGGWVRRIDHENSWGDR